MSRENIEVTDVTKPGEHKSADTSWKRTVFSLLLMVAVYYWLFGSWVQTIILVGTLLFHEAGHFIAMKQLGYRGVNMTFVPFVGAYVSGTATRMSRKNKLTVLLAGPVPGILLGMIFLTLHKIYGQPIYYSIAIPLLLLNGFNLLPIYPLDGGQYFQVLFFKGSRLAQLAFLYLSVAVLGWLFFRSQYNWVMLLIAGMVVLRIRYLHFIGRVRDSLDQQGVEYHCSYEQLTDEEYQQIRKVLINNSSALRRNFNEQHPSEKEAAIIPYVESVLMPAYSDVLSRFEQRLFFAIWLGSWLLPITLFYLY